MRHLDANDIATLKEAYMNERDHYPASMFKHNYAILIGCNTLYNLNELFALILTDVSRGKLPNSSTVGDIKSGYYYIRNQS